MPGLAATKEDSRSATAASNRTGVAARFPDVRSRWPGRRADLRKRAPDPHVLAWYATVSSAELFLSVLTLGEIRLGIERLRRKDEAQADLLEQWLRGLHAACQDHLIDVDSDVAEEWGRLNVPDALPVIDGLLAATAKVRGWTLVTRNTADLQRSSVALLNPFEPPPAP